MLYSPHIGRAIKSSFGKCFVWYWTKHKQVSLLAYDHNVAAHFLHVQDDTGNVNIGDNLITVRCRSGCMLHVILNQPSLQAGFIWGSLPSRRAKQLIIHVLSPRCDFDIRRTWACVEGHFDSPCEFDLVFHCAPRWFPPLFEFISERGITPPFLLYQIVRDKKKVSVKIFKVNVVKIDTRWCFSSTQFRHDSLCRQETCM
jgi:hypothetical protein